MPATAPRADSAARQPNALVTVGRAASDGPYSAVLVDFDETLWLRNSTETYLASLRPRWLAVLLLALLNVARPWRLLPGDRRDFLYRDWTRVLVLSTLMPWSLLVWRWRARALGLQHLNADLLDVLVATGAPLHVVTFGFRPVVGPLLRGLDQRLVLTVCGGLLQGYRTRALGKRACAERELGADVVAGALVVTDSADDRDLLDACRTPVLVRWPASRFEAAFADVYLPFLYTAKGKRPGQRYLLHHVLLEDVVLLGLAFAWSMPSPLLGLLALLFLHASFWLVYEIGYHENDHVAALGERDPVLPAGAVAYGHRMSRAAAWACAGVLSVPGLVLLAQQPGVARGAGGRSGWTALAVLAGLWLGYLLLSRGAYRLYNRLDVLPRGYWYLALQVTRSLGYALLLHVSTVGVMALAAFALARWVPYLSYREVGQHWQTSNRFFFLVVFVVLLGASAAAPGHVLTWQAGAVLAWLTLRCLARRHRPVPHGHPLLQRPAEERLPAAAADL